MRKIVSTLTALILVLCSMAPLHPGKIAYAAGGPIYLGFNPYDTAVDPDYPVVYMTKQGSKTIYAVNYETGVTKTLTLPYPAERLDLYDHKLYVTQLKASHNSFNFGPYSGGIAEVDTSSFTLDGVMNVDADPYDIAIDKDGYIYISPGSGQWSDIKVYSLKDKTEVTNSYAANARQLSTIYYDADASKIYLIDSDTSPRDVKAYEVDHGVIKNIYYSPYHGDYNLNTYAKISPDGQSMYNSSGVVFDLSGVQSGDMKYNFQYDQEYSDYEFSLQDQLTFAASSYGGIDVYKYGTDEYLYTIKGNELVEKLLFKDGLISIYSDSNGKYYLDFINNYGADPFDIADGAYIGYDEQGAEDPQEFYDGVKNVPMDSVFTLLFTQNFTLNDKSKITLKGPNGSVNLTCAADSGVLYIEPEYLLEDSNYTLTIDEGALTGYSGEKLSGGRQIRFQTISSPLTSLSVSVNSQQAPKQYTFTANATGGTDPEYKFLINENGEWDTLQDYSPSKSFVWSPQKNGTYKFEVQARNNGSDAAYEKVYDFTQVVNDSVPPSANLTPNTTAPTNKPVNIQITATDNVGIKSITFPNGNVVNSSSAVYSVSDNGTYVFKIEDLLGNVISKSLQVKNIDKENPKISLIPSTKAAAKNYLIIAVNSSDNLQVKRIKLPNGTYVNGTSAAFPVGQNGTYNFSVEDMAGNITTQSINVANIIKGATDVPTVNPIGDNSSVITGKSEANMTVYAKNGSKTISSAKVSSNGQFSMSIAKQPAGSKISVYAEDPVGNVSSARGVTVMDKTAPAAPKVNTVTTKTTVVTGTAEKGSTVYVYNGTKLLNKSAADSKGAFRINISKQSKNAKLQVTAVDCARNTSKITTIYVK